MKTMLSLGLLTLASILTACASSSASDPSGGPTAQATQADHAADLSGTWAFVLTRSDVAVPIRERCEKSSGGDGANSTACWNEIATQAAKEKIRFGKDSAGHSVWTSFEASDGKESVYVEVPVELSADGPGRVLAKVSGTPKGDQAAQLAKSSINAMRIEVIDAHTIAMTDPRKGRLVYAKE